MLDAVQGILVDALHDEAPYERLRTLVAEAGDALSDAERTQLDAVDADGFRMASLLVRKLRFERAIRGDTELTARFHADPEEFTRLFRAYCADVPPTHYFPRDEAAAFRRHAGLGDASGDPQSRPAPRAS